MCQTSVAHPWMQYNVKLQEQTADWWTHFSKGKPAIELKNLYLRWLDFNPR